MTHCPTRRTRAVMAAPLVSVLLAITSATSALAADGSWSRPGPPINSWGAKAVYDPVRHRLLMMGGVPFTMIAGTPTFYPNPYDVVWSLSLDGTPAWSALPNLPGPAGRESYGLVYDSLRDRLVLFGGSTSSGMTNDVWALPLSGTPVWLQITPAGTPPSGRYGHTAIYDPVRDRMIVFGGNDVGHVDHNDTWALSFSGTPTWTQLAPTGTPPAPRGWHVAIYDPVRDRMVINAGYVWPTNSSLADTWSLSLGGTPAWSPLAASGSSLANNSHTAVYDPAADRMILYGGYGDPAHPANLQVLSFSGSPAWSTMTPAGTPPTIRDGHVSVWDPGNNRMVMCNGLDDELTRVWQVSFTGSPTWGTIAPFGAPPGRRGPAVYDSNHDRMLFFSWSTTDVYAFSLSGVPEWSRLPVTGDLPFWRDEFSVMYDPLRDRVLLHGGGFGMNDVWALNLGGAPTWSQLQPTGDEPGRAAHTAIYDPIHDAMLVFAGAASGYGAFNDVWALTLSGSPGWGELSPAGTTPPVRGGHTAIFDSHRNKMVIFGGYDGAGSFRHDAWEFDLATFSWVEIPATGLSENRVWHTAVYDAPRHRMLSFGGNSGGGQNHDLLALPLESTPIWSVLAPTGMVGEGTQNHASIYDPVHDRMLVYGGSNGVINDPDVWVWTPGSNIGVPGPPVGTPVAIALAEPRPNPSSGTATFEFALPRAGHVSLDVFDAGGRHVRRVVDAELPAGLHEANWRGDDERGRAVRAGLYFLRFESGGDVASRRIVRVR